MIKGRAQVSIDLRALRQNFQLAKKAARGSKMVAVMKANAYGNGLAPAVQALASADIYAVTDVNEALNLYSFESGKPILILQGLIDGDDLSVIAEHNFQLVIHSLEQLDILDEFFPSSTHNGNDNGNNSDTNNTALTFWLKLDSGMGRLGISPEDYFEAYQKLSSKPYAKEVIMMTHLANSSLPDSSLTQVQLDCFANIKNDLNCEIGDIPTSISASAGLLGEFGIKSDWARPGIMMYGSSPFDWKYKELRADKLKIQPVMTLKSKIIAVKEMKAGDNIGYCSQFTCPKDMVIGVVSIGYADGYPSNAPNGTPVLVNGERTSTVGRVSMDMMAVDLSDMADTQIGDVVTLWGAGLSIDEVAAKTGILSYNLMCSVTRRVAFEYLD